MTTPPFQNIRLAPGEKFDEAKQQEVFDAITRNFEDLYAKFQTRQAAAESGNAFLRLVNSGNHKIAWGITGEIAAGATISVTHGLGSIPGTVQLTPFTSAAIVPAVPEAPTKTAFKVKNTGAGAVFVYWLAIA